MFLAEEQKQSTVEFEMAAFLRRWQRKKRDQPGAGKKARGRDTLTNISSKEGGRIITDEAGTWQVLDSRQIPSEMGNERLAMSYVTEAVKQFHLPANRANQLGTAVAEATMNAMEHGNHYDPELPVTLQVLSSEQAIAVRISDEGGNSALPEPEEYAAPDIEARLAGRQSPRGWGLFLIQNMVDEMHILSDKQTHTIELIVYLEGGSPAHKNV